jgi:hypothetical protein
MPKREDHEVHKRTCGGIGEAGIYIYIYIYSKLFAFLLSYEAKEIIMEGARSSRSHCLKK